MLDALVSSRPSVSNRSDALARVVCESRRATLKGLPFASLHSTMPTAVTSVGSSKYRPSDPEVTGAVLGGRRLRTARWFLALVRLKFPKGDLDHVARADLDIRLRSGNAPERKRCGNAGHDQRSKAFPKVPFHKLPPQRVFADPSRTGTTSTCRRSRRTASVHRHHSADQDHKADCRTIAVDAVANQRRRFHRERGRAHDS